MITGMRSSVFLFLVNAFLACSVLAQSTESNKADSSEPSALATDAAKQSPPKRVRVNQGVLKPIRRVDPIYPESARITSTNGIVSLRIVIATDGAVKDVQVIKGDDRLAQSAMAAVKQWIYKPLSVNGTPVEVDTQVDVKFLPR
jgi:TonB family protein